MTCLWVIVEFYQLFLRKQSRNVMYNAFELKTVFFTDPSVDSFPVCGEELNPSVELPVRAG